MSDDFLSNSGIVAAYREKTPTSAKLAAEARELFPSGVTHDVRHLKPYGIYVNRAAGSHKWDADGNDYVDYTGGHGALLLGHNHPEVMAAAAAAMANGTHFGSSHEIEIAWARLIQKLVPSAERVRFTASGTEATHLAFRLARAFTGRNKIIRFKTHFHGWHDHTTSGITTRFDGSASVGVLPSIAENVVLLPPRDIDAVRQALETDDDIAAAILEPTGASFGMIPASPEYVAELRRLTAKHGVVLIFDEVVTGFRVSPGGAQAHLGITPDMTTLAKILAGGFPSGAVVGRKDILDYIDFDVTAKAGREKVQHQGTFNANPVCCAAGLKALEIIAGGEACARANAFGAELRSRLTDVIAEEGVPWAAYGEFSGFHVFTNPKKRDVDPRNFDPDAYDFEELKSNPPQAVHKLRLSMLVEGVDITGWPGGTISAAHGEADMERTVNAFRKSLGLLKGEGEL